MQSYPYGAYDMGGGYPMPMYPPSARCAPASPTLYGHKGAAGSHRPRSSSRGHNSMNTADALQGGQAPPIQPASLDVSRLNGGGTKPDASHDPQASVSSANPLTNGSLNPGGAPAVTEGGGLSALGSLATNQLLAMQAAAASRHPSLANLALSSPPALPVPLAQTDASIPLLPQSASTGVFPAIWPSTALVVTVCHLLDWIGFLHCTSHGPMLRIIWHIMSSLSRRLIQLRQSLRPQ